MSRAGTVAVAVLVSVSLLPGAFAVDELRPFLESHCFACHDEDVQKGGVDFTTIGANLSKAETFHLWERVHDRLAAGEMPPPDKKQPSAAAKAETLAGLSAHLHRAHAAQKGTVLRRLNRREYENTLNDMLGTTLNLQPLFPDDGRSGEFDTIGETLNLSMVQLKTYLEAADFALNASIATATAKPPLNTIDASYKGTREGDKYIGKVWKELPDGAVVRFNDGGYPTGMMRSANVSERGRYRVKLTGYAHQSEGPVSAMIAGTSFARGSSQPVYRYHSFQPGKPQTVEFETIIDRNYMMLIEPYGLSMKQHERKEIASHTGAGLAIKSVEITGPLQESFPLPGHRLLFDGLGRREVEPGNPKDKLRSWYKPKFEIPGEPDVRHSLQRFATRAFRRPVEVDEISSYLALYEREVGNGESPEKALITAASGILCAPQFLFLKEDPGPLAGHALASRLSYFLTRTLPDAALLAAAQNASLTKDLRSHTERLLKSTHANRFVTDFSAAWLDLREINFTNPDSKLFPEFDRYLQWSMLEESRLFLHHLIEADLPVRNVVKSDFAFLNERLASHYGITGVAGAELRKVSLNKESERGGFLSQGAVLKVTANGNNTSPVVRGVWVLERILGIHPQPPPPGIAGVEPDIRGAETLRELLDKHRDSSSCTACHQLIDPPGFALESFDPIGGWRDRFRSLGEGEKVDLQIKNRRVQYKLGRPVDAAGALPDGQAFDGYKQFRDLLAKQDDQLAKNLAIKLLTFATGREMGFSDREEIARIVAESRKHDHGVKELIHLVIDSAIFKTK